ncbi:MAG: hypothetical protein AAFZ15_14640 [Bacteroidota bacterium]
MLKSDKIQQPDPGLMNEIIEGVKILHEKLKYASFKPDIIMSFSRSSQIIGGMLAANFDDVEVINIPKKSVEVGNIIKHKMIVYGNGMKLTPEYYADKKILIVYMAINRGRGLEKAMDYLWGLDIKGDFKVATIYMGNMSREIFQDILYFKEIENFKNTFNNFPWVIEQYHFDG